MGHTLFGYQEFMERLILDKSFIEYFLSKLEEKYLEEIERYLSRVGKYIDIIVLGDDYGTQEDLQISIEMFRQLFKPHLKALCDFIEKRSDVYVFLHSCGAVSKLIPLQLQKIVLRKSKLQPLKLSRPKDWRGFLYNPLQK